MLRRLYDWMMRLAASPRAPLWLAILAFAEGFCFPIPPDVILIPLVLQNRQKAWRYAFITLSASVLGGSVGYLVGYFLHPVGIWLLSLTGSNPHEFEHWYKQWGVLLLALPIPYKVSAIASGMKVAALPISGSYCALTFRPSSWPNCEVKSSASMLIFTQSNTPLMSASV